MTCIMRAMKRLIAFLIIFPIIIPLPMYARGLGSYSRDYSLRLERQRVERERIESLREARIQGRLKSRTRTVIKRTSTRALSTNERLERRKQARAHLDQRRRSRIEDRKMVRTWEQGARNLKDRSDWRLDARRRTDLGSILEIFSRYLYDPDLPNADLLPDSEKEICKTQSIDCNGLDLDILITGRGMKVFPHDPETKRTDPGTGYTVQKTLSGGVLGILMKAPKGNGGEGVEIDWKCPKCVAP